MWFSFYYIFSLRIIYGFHVTAFLFLSQNADAKPSSWQLGSVQRFSARLSEVILLYLAVLDYVLYYLLIELAVGENYELLTLLFYYMFFSLVLFVF